jgi:hypothetical protein
MLSRRTFLGLGLATMALPLPARAGQGVAAPLAELVLRSRAIAVVTPTSSVCRWEDRGGARRIVTYCQARIDELLDGRSEADEVVVRLLGGRVGTIGQVVHGEAFLVRDQACLVFLREIDPGVSAITGLAQGHFPLLADAHGTPRLHPSPRRGDLAEPPGSAPKLLLGRTVPEATTRIRSVREHAR